MVRAELTQAWGQRARRAGEGTGVVTHRTRDLPAQRQVALQGPGAGEVLGQGLGTVANPQLHKVENSSGNFRAEALGGQSQAG